MPRTLLPLGLLLWATALAADSSGPAVGSMAPDFDAHNFLSGADIPLRSQRGKVVILAFWNSWCGSCRRELTLLENAQQAIGKDKLTVLAVSFKENPAEVGGTGRQAGSWQINLIEDTDGSIAHRYAVSTIPYLFMIGRDGTVLASHVGYGDRTLQELLADVSHALAGARR